MRKLYELLGHAKPTKGTFGIEIEAEGDNMEIAQTAFWRSEDDGSLRGRFPKTRAEWVLNEPIVLKDVLPALKQLAEIQKKAKLNFSFRTSVHVHANMHELTYPQILNVIYTYLLLEEPLLNYCGDGRKGNRFCLRLADAEGLLYTLTKVFKEGERGLFDIVPNSVRYAAINLEALNKYGSIEFRSMRGTLDVNVIHTWVRFIDKIRAYAMEKEDVEAIHQEFRDVGANAFVEGVFGKVLTKQLGDDFEREMNQSYSLSIDLPYAYKAYKAGPKIEYERPEIKRRKLLAELAPAPIARVAPPEMPARPIDDLLYAFDYPDVVDGITFDQWVLAKKLKKPIAPPEARVKRVRKDLRDIRPEDFMVFDNIV